MASTASVSSEVLGTIKLYVVTVTSHTDGTVANTLQNSDGNNIIFNGVLTRVTIVPATGDDKPDNNYIMVINDVAGVDVYAGQGGALSQTATSDLCPMLPSTDGTTAGAVPFTLASTLTLAGTGMGSANQTTIYITVAG